MVSRPAAGPEPARTEVLNVFISYSRRDLAFVDRLQAALEARGIDAAVDREDIEKGEEWWKRIEELITEADTVVFVLSPDSAGSEVCQAEVDFAESLNKRIVPVVARAFDGRAPAALARLNYIFFTEGPDAVADGRFEAGVADLVRTLETDIRWIREHTRLGTLARRWTGLDRRDDLLLRGRELSAAETWLTTRPRNAPDPTDDHRALITESRRAATRRQRATVAVSLAAFVGAVTLAGLAFWQMQVAKENERRAEERSALLAADAATDLTAGGAPDEALALLLRAGRVFDAKSAPDKLLIAMEQTIASADRRRRYRFAGDSTAVWLEDAYYVFDPAARRVSRIAGGAAPAPVGTHEGKVAAAAFLEDGARQLIVGTDLAVSELDLGSGASRRVSAIAWPERPDGLMPGDRLRIGTDGLVVVQTSPDEQGRGTVVVHHSGLNRTATMPFDDFFAAFHPVPGADSAGRRFIGEAKSGAVYAIDAGFGSVARAKADDGRWRPRFGCERRPLDRAAPNASAPVDALLRTIPAPFEQRHCARVAAEQVLNRDTSGTSAGEDVSYGYVRAGEETLDVLPHLIALLGPSNTLNLHESSDLAAVDFLPGDTLLVASYNRDVIAFDRERILQTMRTQVPAESIAILSRHEVAIVERLGSALDVTVHTLDATDEAADEAAPLETADGAAALETAAVSDSAEPAAAGHPAPLYFGTCAGYHDAATERSANLPDGARLTIAAASPTSHSDRSEVVIETGTGSTTVPLPQPLDGCVTVSADWRHMLVVTGGLVKVYDVAALRRTGALAGTEIAALPLSPAEHVIAAFFAGPDNDVVTGQWNGEVVRWRLPAPGAQPIRDVIYRGTNPIRYAEPDPDGRRYLILEDLGGGYVRGLLYSAEAQEEWRDLGSEYKWFRLTFVGDDEIEFGPGGQQHARARLPDLPALTARARAAWSEFCRVDDPATTTSPCWPSQFRF